MKLMQYFKPLTHLGKPWQQFKSSPILWKKGGFDNPAFNKSCRSQIWSQIENKERWLTDYSGVFAAQQILSSLTYIWSCKMCSLYTECMWLRNRKWKLTAWTLIQKRFKYSEYWERLPDAPKLYTILESLNEWTWKSRERNMLWEQAAMVRNSAGLRKPLNPGHFGRLGNPGQTHFCRPKKRTCLGKRGRMVTLTLAQKSEWAWRLWLRVAPINCIWASFDCDWANLN